MKLALAVSAQPKLKKSLAVERKQNYLRVSSQKACKRNGENISLKKLPNTISKISLH
jgi:hypothetical protein